MKENKMKTSLYKHRVLHGGVQPGLPPDAVEMLKKASLIDAENNPSKYRIAEIDRVSNLIKKKYPEYYVICDRHGKRIDE